MTPIKSLYPLSCAILLTLLLCVQPVAKASTLRIPKIMSTNSGVVHVSPRLLGVSGKNHSGSLVAFVRLSDPAVLTANGCRELARYGDISIASIPLSRLNRLAGNAAVQRIEAGPPCQIHMDVSARAINATPVYAGQGLPQAFTGKGVLVGVQDIGFDLTHPNFFSQDLTRYRVKRFWDMLSDNPADGHLPVGNEYTTREALLTYARARDAHLSPHGTHTAGCAAGNGFGTPYRGMAFESDLCLVANATSTDVELISEEDLPLFTSALDVLGFQYIFDYADSTGQPCVINFSEGSHQDMAGEDQLLYEVLSQMTGPGRIIVASAGNDGYLNTYFHKPAGTGSMGTFLRNWNPHAYFQMRADKPFTLRTVVYNQGEPNDTVLISSQWPVERPDSEYIDTLQLRAGQYVFDVVGYPSCYDQNKTACEMAILFDQPNRFGYQHPVSVEVLGREADVEFFILSGSMESNALNPLLNAGEKSHSVHFPGSAPSVICVGSTTQRTWFQNSKGELVGEENGLVGERSDFSAVGPTLDYRTKPDVLAPGDKVISAMSSYYLEANHDALDDEWLVGLFDHNGRTYGWQASTGTSMSAPIVAGAIALWLQARPSLTPTEVIDVFAQTCRRDDYSLTYPNNLYGYGEIDVYRGLLYILDCLGIEGLSAHQPQSAAFSLEPGCLLQVALSQPVAGPLSLRLYTTNGQLVEHHKLPAASHHAVSLAHLPRGVYAVQLNGPTPETTGSTLIRLEP